MSLHALHLANGRSGNNSVLRPLGRLLSGSGVIGSTSLAVSAQATPDMTVKVSGSAATDDAIFITSSGDTYYGWNTTNANVTIAANSTGVSKRDAVVAYIQTGLITSTADNPGGMVLTTVRGSGVDTVPTDAEINAAPAISGKPWIRLANVFVANSATSINNGNITDTRTVLTINQKPTAGLLTLDRLASEAWTSYTPAWFASGTSPSIGDGTLSGRYVRIGRTVHAAIVWKAGSTTTFGTGDWIFTLPVPAVSLGAGIHRSIGTFYAEDFGVKGYNGFCNLTSDDAGNVYAGRFVLKVHDAANNGVMLNGGTTVPFTWGSGDFFAATITYEAAS